MAKKGPFIRAALSDRCAGASLAFAARRSLLTSDVSSAISPF